MTWNLSGSYNGLSFGAGANNGVSVSAMSGFDDLPAMRRSSLLRSGDDGSWAGPDYMGERVVTMQLMVIGTDPDDLRTKLSTVIAATGRQNAELPLYVYGSTRVLFCRPEKRHVAIDAVFPQRWATVDLEFIARDPRFYSASSSAPSTGLSGGVTGRSYNLTWPLSWGGASTSGTVLATNVGNTPSRPVVTFVGPLTNPRATNITTGKQVAFTITLGATDTLVVDMDARSAVLNGSGYRRNALAYGSAWWEIIPGANTIGFGSDVFSSTATMTVTYRSAWS